MKSYTIEELEKLLEKYLNSGLLGFEQVIADTEVAAFLRFVEAQK